MSNFVWNVDREIFRVPLYFFEFPLRWYSLLFAGGLIIAYFIIKKMFVDEKKPVELVEAYPTYIVLGTLIGARLGHCLFYEPAVYLADPIKILKVYEGGLASHGGFLGVIIAIILFVRKSDTLSFFWLADRSAIACMFSAACIRIGNFFNSEIVGSKTDVPWGVIFAKNGESIARHPSQLYEAVGYAAIGFIGMWLYKNWDKKIPEGRMMGIIMILGFGYRLIMEVFKENQVTFENSLPMNMGQILSIPFILVGVYFALLMHHQNPFFQKGMFPKK